MFAPVRGEGRSGPTRSAAAAGVPLRSALWLLVHIVAVPELAVLDLGAGAHRLRHRTSGAWARVAYFCSSHGLGGVWEAIEDVYAGWHAAGEPRPVGPTAT
jgi:hypothetical protein